MKRFIALFCLLFSTSIFAEEVITGGAITERVFQVANYIDFDKVVEGREPKVIIKGVELVRDCNGPNAEKIDAQVQPNEETRRPVYDVYLSYIETRMGCFEPIDLSKAETFMFNKPVELEVTKDRSYISLLVRNSKVRALILEIKY